MWDNDDYGAVSVIGDTMGSMSLTSWPRLEARYGSGWQPILDRLAEELRELDPQIEISQVKEKFGLLRVSAFSADPALQPRVRELIRAATEESATTCERCGVAGAELATVGDYWKMTLCSSCAAFAERDRERLAYRAQDLGWRMRGMSAGAPVLLETDDGQLLELTGDAPGADAMVQAMLIDGQLEWVRAGSPRQRDGALLGGMVPGLILRVYQHGEGR